MSNGSPLSVKVRLDHVAIASSTEALPKLLSLFGELGLRRDHTEAVPDQGVVTHFIPISVGEGEVVGDGAQLELLEAVDPQGTVARFLASRGPGIHHLSFEVVEGGLDALCGALRAKGYRLVYDAPKAGAHGMRVNFVHPGSAGGVLVELAEKAAGGGDGEGAAEEEGCCGDCCGDCGGDDGR